MAQQAWTDWFSSLSSVAKVAAELPYKPNTGISPVVKVTNADEQSFKNNLDMLSEFTRTLLQEENATEMPVGDVAPNPEAFGYWIVECVDGEAPKIKKVQSSTALSKYLSSAEGKDVYVFPFYGTALPVTQGPQRYLYLPDGATAITIPVAKNGRVEEVDSEVLRENAKMQADYYFGSVEMRTSVVFKEDKKPAQRSAKQVRNDDDFDD